MDRVVKQKARDGKVSRFLFQLLFIVVKIGKNSAQYVDRHLFSLQWLMVYDLLELFHDI